MEAIKANNFENVHILIAQKGINVNLKDKNKLSCLMYACSQGFSNCVKLLLDVSFIFYSVFGGKGRTSTSLELNKSVYTIFLRNINNVACITKLM